MQRDARLKVKRAHVRCRRLRQAMAERQPAYRPAQLRREIRAYLRAQYGDAIPSPLAAMCVWPQ